PIAGLGDSSPERSQPLPPIPYGFLANTSPHYPGGSRRRAPAIRDPRGWPEASISVQFDPVAQPRHLLLKLGYHVTHKRLRIHRLEPVLQLARLHASEIE